MTLISESVFAYVNHGRWVADCGRDFCSSAMALKGSQTTFQCGGPEGCGWQGIIVWPSDAQEIWDALMRRPVKATRNWYPIGHPIAERANLPAGQSAQDLIDEQKEREAGG